MDDDYYSTVYTWFEKCGIISHIRTHLRQNLVNALKYKDLSLTRDNKPKLAKQYIYDLLIAEYLFNFNYAYTLSVFASEAPFLINFHNYIPEFGSDKEKSNKQKLQIDYVSHTLETVGIKPYGPKGQYIISEYTASDLPLLLCILKCMESTSLNTDTEFEVNKVSHDMHTQTDHLLIPSASDITKLQAAKKKIIQQKKLFDTNLKEKEMKLREQAVIIDHQVKTLNEKLEQVQHLMNAVVLKEKELNEKQQNDAHQTLQKEMELTHKQNLLLQEAERLQNEREYCKKFETDLKKLQEELIKVQKELPCGGNSNITTRDIHIQTDFDSYTLKSDEIKTLQKEKKELTNLVEEQQRRIEHLTSRAVQLSRQLEEIHLLKITETPVSGMRIINTNTVISESSSTEDILQDARMRLKRLEEESLKANQYYYNCIATSP